MLHYNNNYPSIYLKFIVEITCRNTILYILYMDMDMAYIASVVIETVLLYSNFILYEALATV